MADKEELKNLIKSLKISTGLRQEQISKAAGYRDKSLTQILSGGEGIDAAIRRLKSLNLEELKKINRGKASALLSDEATQPLKTEDAAKVFAEINKKLDWLTINLEESKRVVEQNNALIQAGLFAHARSVAAPEKIDELFQSSIEFAREILKRNQDKLLNA